jgi:hypothetical protein
MPLQWTLAVLVAHSILILVADHRQGTRDTTVACTYARRTS